MKLIHQNSGEKIESFLVRTVSRGAILTVLKFEIGSLVSNVYCLLADSPTFSPRLLVELNLDHIVNVLRPDMFLNP